MNNLINNYGDLEDYLKLFEGSKSNILRSDGKIVEVLLKLSGTTLVLTEKNLVKLCHGKRFKKKGFSYINHCGFTYENYGEVCIKVFHPSYEIFDEANEWRAKPLKFKINKKIFEIGPSSPLFVLINEPIYRDSDWQYDFHNFATIKVAGTNEKEIKDDIVKALYYLNSHYLKVIGFATTIQHLDLMEDDTLDLWENDIDDIFQKINRVRTKTRKDFSSVEPLSLYNKAQTMKDDEKFLYIYRILEFFMNRVRTKKVNEMRFDKNISDAELLKTIDKKNEETLLSNLLNETLSSNQKEKLSKYAFNKKLITEDKYTLIPRKLYKYRNSIVHAKEHNITDTVIPDPFVRNIHIQPWLYIVDDVATRCIRKYNLTSRKIR